MRVGRPGETVGLAHRNQPADRLNVLMEQFGDPVERAWGSFNAPQEEGHKPCCKQSPPAGVRRKAYAVDSRTPNLLEWGG